MRLAVPLLLLLLAAAPAAAQSPTATVRTTACVTNADQAQRSATFEGDMRAVRHGPQLQMRFTLQSRAQAGASWTRVAAPNFDQWQTAAPGKARYVYDKTVENLPYGDYRALVRFRWRTAAGVTVLALRRVSRACHQPDPRPNLVAVAIHTRPGSSADTRVYEVVVRNTGRSDAPPFAVALTVDGTKQPDNTGPGLAAGDRAVAAFEAPACHAGSTVTASVDPSAAVSEADEDDNTISVPCPA
jgi:hypothetical protein